jgi:hypothetical protein
MTGKTRSIRVSLAILLLSSSAVVRAQAADPSKAQAQASLREGNALLEAGRPAEALTKFREAYRLFPSPKIHYNIGQAQSLIPGQEAQAYQAMSRFLAEAKDANLDLRKAAETQRQQLRSKVALISVAAEPADSDLVVNGVSSGNVATAMPLVLGVGPHRLMLRKDPAVSDEETLAITGGETLEVRLKLRSVTSVAPPPPVSLEAVKSPGPPPPVDVLRLDASAHPSEQKSSSGHWTWQRKLGAGLAGAGAASLVFGIVEHVRRQSSANDFIKAGCGTNDLSIGVGCQGLNDRVGAADVGMALGYIGAAILGGSGAYFLWLSRSDRSAAGESGTPASTPQAMTLNLQGRF